MTVGGTTYLRTTQSLDWAAGAGRMDLATTFGLQVNGQTDVIGTGTGSLGLVARTGWDFGSAVVGKVTSGGFSPTLSTAIAMGFVPPALALVGTPLSVIVRGKSQPAQVVAMPFVPHRYVRKS